MANRPITLESGGQTYSLSLSINAIVEVEKLRGEKINAILGGLNSPDGADFAVIRDLIWAMLLDNHPDITIQEAGRIMPAGGFLEITDKLTLAVQNAMPPPSEAGAENPRQAGRTRTGTKS